MNSFKEMKKLEEGRQDGKVRCKCSHTMILSATTPYAICNNCGAKLQNNTISRFRYLYYKERNKNNERN